MGAGERPVSLHKASSVIPNMTPMVDVVMCILIFFMLGSTFLLPEWLLENRLPAVAKGTGTQSINAPLPPVRMFIRLTRRGGDTWVTAFDARALKMDGPGAAAHLRNAEIQALFTRKAATLSPEVQVLICPEGRVAYQDLITIYDYCVGAKFTQVAFAPADSGGGLLKEE